MHYHRPLIARSDDDEMRTIGEDAWRTTIAGGGGPERAFWRECLVRCSCRRPSL